MPEVPATVQREEQIPIIDSGFIYEDGTVVSAKQYMSKSVGFGVGTSSQEDARDETKEITSQDIVRPPYSPDTLSRFLDLDEVHYRCVRTKVTDSVERPWKLIRDENYGSVEDSVVDAERAVALDFIDSCNHMHGFEGVLTCGCMDFESVGWAAFEVVRGFDKRILNLYHIPASKIRVLKGWRGFVEKGSSGRADRYYLPFGWKVLSPDRTNIYGYPLPYDPVKDGGIERGQWNLVSPKDPNERLGFREIEKSANEILFVPKFHPKTTYYGIPDFLSAVGSILCNIYIRDYTHQFFEHNAVPRYAIIVKGATLDDPVKKLIMSYLSEEVKGSAHKTLIIPIPSMAGDIEVKFERLDTDVKEASFQSTRSNNQKSIVISHGMFPAVVGIIENAQMGSGKGVSQQLSYKNRIVTPLQTRWQKTVRRLFRYGLGLKHITIEFESLDAEDLSEQTQNYINYVQNGIMTINQVRERGKIGPPLDGGDRAFVLSGNLMFYVDELGLPITEDPKRPMTTNAEKALRKKLLNEGINKVLFQ